MDLWHWFKSQILGYGPRPRTDITRRTGLNKVQRNTCPLYKERGWRMNGRTLRGFYRTTRGSFEGRISKASSSTPEFYIVKPPPTLLNGEHGPCFTEKNKNLFAIHFHPAPKGVDAGIRAIERAILEALS